ncbi:multiple PDZ domain protein-like [Oppia nitens]|uniref:multiple PDZ domain protein-like n=1 Tax=Oppia nitens TaxID=1686743 RepID=UPI0023DBC359|nr:multiple PDZ domain protein-like [Oppia nitens]
MSLTKSSSASQLTSLTNERIDPVSEGWIYANKEHSFGFSDAEVSLMDMDYDNDDNDNHKRYEILLLPDIKPSTGQITARLSPPLMTQSLSMSTVVFDTDLGVCMTSGDHDIDADVSPTRIALSNIQEFVETTVVLRKDKKNELGISIVGGNDTYLESICVKEVHKDSAAYRDGRLRKGDLILAVNDRSMRDITFKDAVQVLREAPSPLRLIILRENAQKLFTTHQCPTKFITVELRKGSIKDKLGLSLMQRTNGRGVFITYVQPNSIASQHRAISQGDQILEINGQNVRESNQKDVSQILYSLDGNLVLLLGRVPSLHESIKEWARRRAQIFLRTRTSTWSSSVGNCNEKLQAQRPSLPVNNKDKSYFQMNSLSPDSDIGMTLPTLICQTINNSMTDITNETQQQLWSRSSSLRSQKRLSIVAEDSKQRESMDSNSDEELDSKHTTTYDNNNIVTQVSKQNPTSDSPDNPLLPSIKVTEF